MAGDLEPAEQGPEITIIDTSEDSDPMSGALGYGRPSLSMARGWCSLPASRRAGHQAWNEHQRLDPAVVISNSKMSQNLQVGIEPPR